MTDAAAPTVTAAPTLGTDELVRYARHLTLPEVGLEGQPQGDGLADGAAQQGLALADQAVRVADLGPQGRAAESAASPRRWRQRVKDERSNGSSWRNTASPQKYW